MIYCDECAEKNGLPVETWKFFAECAICDKAVMCNETGQDIKPLSRHQKHKRYGYAK